MTLIRQVGGKPDDDDVMSMISKLEKGRLMQSTLKKVRAEEELSLQELELKKKQNEIAMRTLNPDDKKEGENDRQETDGVETEARFVFDVETDLG